MKTLTLSPVDRGRREPQEAASASLTYKFIPVKPHPDLKASGLFVGLVYSFAIAGFFTGLGYVALRIVQKIMEWL